MDQQTISKEQANPPTAKADDLTGLRCPKCDYELTGLAKTRCPECGTVFDPQALRTFQANAKPAELESYARFIRNCAVVNLILQVSVSLLIKNAGLLGHETLDIIQTTVSGFGLLGGAIGMSLAFITIIHAGIRDCYIASWLALATLIMSAAAAYVSLLNL